MVGVQVLAQRAASRPPTPSGCIGRTLRVEGRPDVVAVGVVPRRAEHWSIPTDTAKRAARRPRRWSDTTATAAWWAW
ncbi:hypothetical protein ACSNOI_04470 [Actinomadura kijaniata]|uniref:hypothetical protein n=1 Tax=Actinomadura kijaniata TaxID=46161 RepID=UPI003F1D13F4